MLIADVKRSDAPQISTQHDEHLVSAIEGSKPVADVRQSRAATSSIDATPIRTRLPRGER